MPEFKEYDEIATIASGDISLIQQSSDDVVKKTVRQDAVEILTNKTLTSPGINTPTISTPVMNGTVSGTAIKDEDDMASDSESHLVTQQSSKAYSDSKVLDEDDMASNSTTEAPSQQSTVAYTNSLFSGMIVAFAAATAPDGFLDCDGTAVSRTTYATLFSRIGTTWGVGDGSTTFNLPDLRGMFLRGSGTHGTLNMADGNDFAGPAVGASENDSFQQHHHEIKQKTSGLFTNPDTFNDGGGASRNRVNSNASEQSESYQAKDNVEGTQGTARHGDETRPVNYGVNYIIKT